MRFPSKTAKELIQDVEGFRDRWARFVQDQLQRVLGIHVRLAFTKKKYRSSTQCDVSAFGLVNPQSVIVRRPSGISGYKQMFTVKTVIYAESVMVWGCFSASRGRWACFSFRKNQMMNGEIY
jgi:hypothetical protein